MNSILFHNINQSKSIAKYFKRLFSDYTLFKEKHFSNLCLSILKKIYPNSNLWLTHSATAGLEIIATLINIKKGDEIIMPSFTFVSTANAFVVKGATPIFVDIKSTDLNINEKLIEQAISPKTKAIVVMHYSGVACNLNSIKAICKKHKLLLIEDSAMGFGCSYKKKPLGTIGDFGVISFDITKQISATQGGLLLVNNPTYQKRVADIYHVGTNRQDFDKGIVNAYEWVDYGSKYQMSELNAVMLFDELKNSTKTFNRLSSISAKYYANLAPYLNTNLVKLFPKNYYQKNLHAFPIVCKNNAVSYLLLAYLNKQKIQAARHYQPLHSSKMGKIFNDKFSLPITEKMAENIVRIPFYSSLKQYEITRVVNALKNFFHEHK